jgi:hypothetical protein
VLQLDSIAAVGREVPAPVHSYDLHLEAIIVNPERAVPRKIRIGLSKARSRFRAAVDLA